MLALSVRTLTSAGHPYHQDQRQQELAVVSGGPHEHGLCLNILACSESPLSSLPDSLPCELQAPATDAKVTDSFTTFHTCVGLSLCNKLLYIRYLDHCRHSGSSASLIEP